MGKFDLRDIAYRAYKLYLKKHGLPENEEEARALWDAAFDEGNLLGSNAWMGYMALRGDELYPETKEEKA